MGDEIAESVSKEFGVIAQKSGFLHSPMEPMLKEFVQEFETKRGDADLNVLINAKKKTDQGLEQFDEAKKGIDTNFERLGNSILDCKKLIAQLLPNEQQFDEKRQKSREEQQQQINKIREEENKKFEEEEKEILNHFQKQSSLIEEKYKFVPPNQNENTNVTVTTHTSQNQETKQESSHQEK